MMGGALHCRQTRFLPQCSSKRRDGQIARFETRVREGDDLAPELV
jgi:hypothetical protein